MASLLLSAAGAAIGGSIGGPIGAVVGRIAGAVGGSMIDQSLFSVRQSGARSRTRQGPRFTDLSVSSSSEGAAMPRVHGRVRVGGEIIWATSIEEVVSTSTQTTTARGGKGRAGSRGSAATSTTVTTTYSYFANFAVGLCEGQVGRIGRIWADGKLLDQEGLEIRAYLGGEEQEPDPLILAKQGEGGSPAYRGLAYLVFERFPLARYGNRIPQLSVEVFRPIGKLEAMVRAVTLIPGATEFGYDTTRVIRIGGAAGVSLPENRHQSLAATDLIASLDDLQATCPNIERIALVSSWYGDDLRAGACTIRPCVDAAVKETYGDQWLAAGLTRASARLVSQVDGRSAYGGTPSDASLIRAIREMKARSLKVTLYPFVMMDIPADNTLPDPWGAASQPAYPWRGRITCHPAPGQSETVDGTSTAASQINAFFGTALPSHYAVAGDRVLYSGPDEWSYRRMVLHNAVLAKAAGGVEAFIIGSEMKALTCVRSASGVYPAVSALIALAADVRAILGPLVKITYAADWTEYGAHVVDEVANEVRFPLDPLWASADIDMIGIDFYPPLSDWRDGDHMDAELAQSPRDVDYLRSRLHSGEAYDWYYASGTAREVQIRTPITDGLGKPWIYRQKDMAGFWANQHFERVDGVELAAPTAWQPGLKPIWLTETGCPAVDKGANQPSVFPDAKSAEAGLPYFSTGARDDLMQRRFLEAVITGFDPMQGASELDNPLSPFDGRRMLEPSAIHLWTWDARPWPVFPAAADVWADAANWETGHWLTGRLGSAPLDDLVLAIAAGAGDVRAESLGDGPMGHVIDRPMAPRAALEPLSQAFAFDAAEDADGVVFRRRGGRVVAEFTEDDLVLPDKDPLLRRTRAEENGLPAQASLAYADEGRDYARAAVIARRQGGHSQRVAEAELAVVMSDAAARRAAEIWLRDLWVGRETLRFALPPSRLALVPGDVIALACDGRRALFEILDVADAETREVTARAVDPALFDLALPAVTYQAPAQPPALGPPLVHILELPTVSDSQGDVLQWIAGFARPWPGPLAVWRSPDGLAYEGAGRLDAAGVMGITLDPLPAGPLWRFDRANAFRVVLSGGALVQESMLRVLGGANVAALRAPDGRWEVIQFADAELVAPDTWRLSTLLRGQAGSEPAMPLEYPVGTPFVLLDAQAVPLVSGADALGQTMRYRVGAADRDHGDSTIVEIQTTPGATALKPLAPVHLQAHREAGGIRVSWVRRTRRGGDGWEQIEVPLGETSERYRLDILDGDSIKRTIETTSPETFYATDEEVADFGGPQTSLDIRVAQLSATVGAGHPTRAILTL